MEVFLETERLLLRRLTVDDVDTLYELDRDPEVMRLLTNGVPTPYEVVRDELLPRLLAEQGPRHGRFATIERSTQNFLGWHGLQVRDNPQEAELGYRLRRSAWGKGYATEGAEALVCKAFTELGFERVSAETMAINAASRRVMEKAGLVYVRTFHLDFEDPIPGTELGEVEYAVTRAQWQANRLRA